jgi:para-nitrobenzyl esterase
VVDGVALPQHPFDPAAPAISRDKPLMVGWNEDEYTFFAWQRRDASGFGIDFDALREKLAPRFGARHGADHRHLSHQPAVGLGDRHLRQVQSVAMMGFGSIEIAERKAAQRAAPSISTTSATSRRRRCRHGLPDGHAARRRHRLQVQQRRDARRSVLWKSA